MFRNQRYKRGQSTMEYIILVTAVVAVILIFVNNKDAGFQKKMSESLDTAASEMVTKSSELDATHKGKINEKASSTVHVGPDGAGTGTGS